MNDRTRALRVGSLVMLSLVILVAILVVTGPLSIVRGATVNVDFAFAGPIKPGASVRISGVVVGAVQSVVLLAGQDKTAGADKMVRVVARVEDRVLPAVTERARFRVTTLGILGEHYLDIEPVAGGTPLVDGARIDGVTQARPDLLLSRAAGLLERADELLPSSPEAVALLRSATALMTRIDAVLAHADGPADDDLRALLTDLRTLVHGAAVGIGDGRALRSTFEKLPPALDTLDKLDAPALAAELRTTLADARRVMTVLEKEPLADPVRQEQLRNDLESTLHALESVSKRADRLLGAVEEKRGAAGKLFWDEEAAGDLKAVLKGLRADPVRFFLGGKPPP